MRDRLKSGLVPVLLLGGAVVATMGYAATALLRVARIAMAVNSARPRA